MGTGTFGTVRMAVKKNNPNRQYAIKTIEKKKLKSKEYMLTRELEIL